MMSDVKLEAEVDGQSGREESEREENAAGEKEGSYPLLFVSLVCVSLRSS